MKTNKKIVFFKRSIDTLIEWNNEITPKEIRKSLSKVAKRRDLPNKLVSIFNRLIRIASYFLRIISIKGFFSIKKVLKNYIYNKLHIKNRRNPRRNFPGRRKITQAIKLYIKVYMIKRC